MNLNKTTKVYIAGHRGMVGSAVWRALESKGYTNLIGKTSKELDLRNQHGVISKGYDGRGCFSNEKRCRFTKSRTRNFEAG